MKKKWFAIFAVTMALLSTACNTSESSFIPSSQLSMENTENSKSVSEPLPGLATKSDEDETEVGGGSNDACTMHTFSYHSICAELINYVGQETGHEWVESVITTSQDPYKRIGEDMTILAFIEHFNIPKDVFIEVTRTFITDAFLEIIQMTREEYYTEFGYTDEQIDALYSGDKRLINETFCGPLAFVNEADGELYSIYWLEEHTAEDYAAAGLPLEQVEAVLEAAASGDYGDQSQRITAIEPALAQAYVLAEDALAAEQENLETDSFVPATEQEEPLAENASADEENAAE